MVKLKWHIGDVVRKIRWDVLGGATQSDLGLRPNTLSDFEHQTKGWTEKTLNEILEGLSKAMQQRGLPPLRAEDLFTLVPIDKSEAVTPPVTPTLNDQERQLLAAFRHLEVDRQKILIRIADSLGRPGSDGENHASHDKSRLKNDHADSQSHRPLGGPQSRWPPSRP